MKVAPFLFFENVFCSLNCKPTSSFLKSEVETDFYFAAILKYILTYLCIEYCHFLLLDANLEL